MARVWVYDRTAEQSYRDSVERAKEAGRTPPGRWQVRWYDVAGKLKSKTYTTKPPAEKYRTKIDASLNDDSYRDPSAGRVQYLQVAEEWLDARTDLKRSSRNNYRTVLDVHVLPRWGDLPVSAIETGDIAAWLAWLQKPKGDGGKNLGASQTRLVHTVLSAPLDRCVPDRLSVNPADGVPLPRLPLHDDVVLTYDQVETLAAAAGNLATKHGKPTAAAGVNKALILTLAYVGLRFGEAAAIRVGKVDLAARRIRIDRALSEINGELHEDSPKSGKPRTVAIPGSLVAELKRLTDGRDAGEYVFTTGRGYPLRLRGWRYKEFSVARTAAGLDGLGLTPHGLRHVYATLAIAEGADVKVIQRQLGHKNATETLNRYGHLFPDRLDEVADAMDARRMAATEGGGTTAESD